MDKTKELTRAEEQVMQILWDLNGGFIKDIIEKLPEKKPAYNTISTIVRILETKGFVDHEAYGKSHRYIPVIQKKDYKHLITGKLLSQYFNNSPQKLFSYFLEENKLDVNDLDEILALIKKHK